MSTQTDQLVDLLYSTSLLPLSEQQQHTCRLRLLDYMGVTYAGAKLLEKELAAKYLFSGANHGGSAIVGTPWYTTPEVAALLNGMSAHAAELDDGERYGMVHPGSPVISAVLAIVQARKLNLDALLKGIYVGYEATILLARQLQPAMKDKGYHATGTCGSIGAAMGVAAACGFTRQQMKSTFCAAVTSASGILKVIRGASELKPYNVGQAAMNGVAAAGVAAMNLISPEDVLEGEQGFFCMMTGKASQSIGGIKPVNAVECVYIKPYAACRHCHGPIDAVLTLREHGGFSLQDIESISITTHRYAVYLHDHVIIEGSASAKMSVPYSVAVALVTGRAGMQEFSDTSVTDPTILALTRKIHMHADEELTALVPGKRAAIVEIRTLQGDTFTARVDLPKGEPENPVSEQELIEKFCDLAVFSGKEQKKAKWEALQILHAEWPAAIFTGKA